MSTRTIGLIGRKVGMTQVFQDDGTMVAVRVLAVEPNTVTRLRTTERDGYTAVAARHRTQPQAQQARGGPVQDARQGCHARDRPRVPPRQRRRVRARPEAGRLAVRGGRAGRRDGRLQGQGLLRPHQAPPLQARPQDPRLRPSPRAGFDRPRHDAGPRLQGHAHGRPHGRRSRPRSRSCASCARTPSATFCSSRARCPARGTR